MMPGLSGRNRNGSRYTWVFPSLTFAAGTEALWAYDAKPLGPSRCHVTQWVCFPPQTVAAPDFEDKAERYYKRMDEALDEDIGVLEQQQAGMASAFARPGRWSELEEGAAAFAACMRHAWPPARNLRDRSLRERSRMTFETLRPLPPDAILGLMRSSRPTRRRTRRT